MCRIIYILISRWCVGSCVYPSLSFGTPSFSLCPLPTVLYIDATSISRYPQFYSVSFHSCHLDPCHTLKWTTTNPSRDIPKILKKSTIPFNSMTSVLKWFVLLEKGLCVGLKSVITSYFKERCFIFHRDKDSRFIHWVSSASIHDLKFHKRKGRVCKRKLILLFFFSIWYRGCITFTRSEAESYTLKWLDVHRCRDRLSWSQLQVEIEDREGWIAHFPSCWSDCRTTGTDLKTWRGFLVNMMRLRPWCSFLGVCEDHWTNVISS